nr:uncharacterized mitochondrial protein AtMg00810-like [Tanacetum cinerariifolium]
HEEKQIEEEQAANAQYWKIPACCDDDDDYNSAITHVLSIEEPNNSLKISSGSTTTHSNIFLPNYDVLPSCDDHIEEISSGSSTTHYDISLSEYDSFTFDLSNDQFPPTDMSDFANEEFAGELAHIIAPPEIHENPSTTHVNLPVEDDYSPLLAYVVWIFLAYLTLLHLAGSQPMLKSSYKVEDGVRISTPPLVGGVADVVVEIKGTVVPAILQNPTFSFFPPLTPLPKTSTITPPAPFSYIKQAAAEGWKAPDQYSTQSRAYRVFNKRTRVIVETIHVNFDELPHMASDHVSSDPAPQCQRTTLEHDSLSPGPQSQENAPQAARIVTTSNELDLLFSPMFNELFNGSTQVVSKSSAETTADAPNKYSDHAGCLDSRKSTSGGIQFLGGDKLVSWSSKKQDGTSRSSAEAEYVSLSTCCAQVLWLRTQLTDYGFHFDKIPITEYQLADLFTKALSEDRFKYLVRRLEGGEAIDSSYVLSEGTVGLRAASEPQIFLQYALGEVRRELIARLNNSWHELELKKERHEMLERWNL